MRLCGILSKVKAAATTTTEAVSATKASATSKLTPTAILLGKLGKDITHV